MNWPMRAALRHPRSDGRLPWWYPPQRPDARAATVLGLLATLSLVVGYHGTLLSRTMTFAADEFGAGSAAQGDALAAARIGGVLAVGLGALADRRGRRLILSLALVHLHRRHRGRRLRPRPGDAGGDAGRQPGRLGRRRAPAGRDRRRGDARRRPGLRPQPAGDDRRPGRGHRAVGPAGRRPRRTRVARALPGAAGVRAGRHPVRPADPREPAVRPLPPATCRWPATIAGSCSWPPRGSCSTSSPAPQSQFLNEYLRDERGMSAAMISLFILLTSTPASIGIVVGGRLADTRGRRVVGAVAASVGSRAHRPVVRGRRPGHVGRRAAGRHRRGGHRAGDHGLRTRAVPDVAARPGQRHRQHDRHGRERRRAGGGRPPRGEPGVLRAHDGPAGGRARAHGR